MRRLGAWWDRRLGAADEGSAIVEFLGAALVLLLPLAYLVLALGRIQAGTFAVESAARESARIVVTRGVGEGSAQVEAAVRLALEDQGFTDVDATDVTLRCSSDPCGAAGSSIEVTVRHDVALPLVPRSLGARAGTAVPVEAVQVMVVDDYAAAP